LPLHLLDYNISAVRSGNGPPYHEEVPFRVDRNHQQILAGLLSVPKMPRHPRPLDDSRRERRCADRAWCAVEHRSVSRAASATSVTLDESRKSAALGPPYNVYKIIFPEDVDQDLIADARRILTRIQSDLAQDSRGGHACAFEVAFHRLVDLARRFVLNQPELDRVIPVRVDGLFLNDNARPRFDHRDRRHSAVVIEDLSHPYFLAYYSVDHSYSAITARPVTRAAYTPTYHPCQRPVSRRPHL